MGEQKTPDPLIKFLGRICEEMIKGVICTQNGIIAVVFELHHRAGDGPVNGFNILVSPLQRSVALVF